MFNEKDSAKPGLSRRTILKGSAGVAALATLGAPAIVRAQSDMIRVGHLTPRTGFLGPLGEYGVMGVTLATEEINAAGGVLGRKIELLAEDSVNPSTASTKADRMIGRDNVIAILGEISSASGLAISQVAGREKVPFIQTGCNSDELRGKSCNRYMFHIEGANTMYINAVGDSLKRENLVEGKTWFGLTADYAYGHDLLEVCRNYARKNGADLGQNELVPTDSTDFSPFILKIRRARPDVVVSNLAGNQITNFIKQYKEYGLEYPLAGGGFDTAAAWGAGPAAFAGIWPAIWHHSLDTPSAKAFTEAFTKRWGKPPENQAWGDYLGMKILAQAIAETGSTDAEGIVGHLESGAKFDVLKGREGYFRSWDHQLMNEMYSIRPKPADKQADQWDMLLLGDPVPGPGEDLETIATTRADSACNLG
ncbi:ABC transporter substrate-binding protein (plasmid) [Skermanella rosea]|uniref:substrate-binding domain-containing protein n=1 Tax=Skermanella rosea TaxID=1817965 RepID=UPI0019345ECE|nr:ABC transporter substrate-binding protein [Skermanella rosea]UEM07842.1 ABC transporter substrate-binding protein [Skermanella rosea]